jgi:hypothetical protein
VAPVARPPGTPYPLREERRPPKEELVSDDRSIFDRLKERGEEVFTQVSGELMSNPHFMKAMEGALKGKEFVDEAATRALKSMNVPTRSDLKKALIAASEPGSPRPPSLTINRNFASDFSPAKKGRARSTSPFTVSSGGETNFPLGLHILDRVGITEMQLTN